MTDAEIFSMAYARVSDAAWARFMRAFDISGNSMDARAYTRERWDWALEDPEWAEALMLVKLGAKK